MIKYKCRYMYDEWNCIVKCIERKMEYTVLEFYSQYFNIKMHLGSIDNEFWCFFPEYNNMFTELLSPIDFYNNIDILDELFKNPYESMTVAKGIKKYFETQLEENTVESHSVYFITCQELMLQLKRAESENRLDQRLKFFTRQKLLIIDEIGYINLDKEDANLFFQLISRRYEQRSTIITTNKNLSKWSTIFGDPVIANAILDRLLHHSHIVSIVGPSYRIKDVMDSFEN